MNEYEPLRQYLELARTLNFTRAARACHVAPSTLSRSIRRLEVQIGQPLVERQHHHVELTPIGEAFRRHAVAVLDEWHRFADERGRHQGVLSGTIHIYCSVTASQTVVPELLGQVRRAHPGLRVQLTTGYSSDAVDRVHGGEIDLSIANLPEHLPAGLVGRALGTTPLIFAAPTVEGPVRDALNRRTIPWADVPFVLPAYGLARDYADGWFEQRSLRPVVYAEIAEHEAILSLVVLGCGVGVVPQLVVDNNPLKDRVVELPVRPRLGSLSYGLCARERSLSNPLINAVWSAT